jgi:hypothetical protein
MCAQSDTVCYPTRPIESGLTMLRESSVILSDQKVVRRQCCVGRGDLLQPQIESKCNEWPVDAVVVNRRSDRTSQVWIGAQSKFGRYARSHDDGSRQVQGASTLFWSLV